MHRIVALLALLVVSPVMAENVTWNWVNPTTNTNGTPIPTSGAGSLNGGRLEFGTCNGSAFGVKAGEIPLTQAHVTAHSVTQTDILPSTICGRIYVRNTYGSESVASNVASVVVATPTPNPPTSLNGVTVNVTVNINP